MGILTLKDPPAQTVLTGIKCRLTRDWALDKAVGSQAASERVPFYQGGGCCATRSLRKGGGGFMPSFTKHIRVCGSCIIYNIKPGISTHVWQNMHGCSLFHFRAK